MNAPTSLQRLLLAAFLSLGPAAFAQSGASVCGSLLMSDEKANCMRTIAGHTIEPGAAGVCSGVLMSSDKATCLFGTMDKHYAPEELAACRGVLMGGDKASCMVAAGRAPERQRAVRRDDDDDRPARSRRQRDDDDDDDRPRSRHHRDDDDRDDRREDRRDSNRTRTFRFTNYYNTTISHVYWRLVGEKRFREIRLPAAIGVNRYQDVSVADEVIDLCAETRDGYFVWWLRLDMAQYERVDIAANQQGWTQGRCSGH